jgi:hypothetical protein
LKNRSDVLLYFKELNPKVEVQLGRKVRVLRTNGGGECIFGDFSNYYEAHGVIKQQTFAYTPQQNGVA